MKTGYLLLVAAALLSVPAVAQDYVVSVNGIVCEFCSIGVRKKLSRLPFVDTSKYDDGVIVDIEHQRVTVAVKEGMPLERAALFDAIKSAGYNPVEIFQLAEDGELRPHTP